MSKEELKDKDCRHGTQIQVDVGSRKYWCEDCGAILNTKTRRWKYPRRDLTPSVDPESEEFEGAFDPKALRTMIDDLEHLKGSRRRLAECALVTYLEARVDHESRLR